MVDQALAQEVKPFVLGIAGGSGAGKTTLAQGLADHYGDQAAVLQFGTYYLPEGSVPNFEGVAVWDHPEAWDHQRFAADLRTLIGSSRKPLVITEGFLLLAYDEVRSQLDHAIYLDGPLEEHVARRLHEFPDRYPKGLFERLHKQYVLPTKSHANTIYDTTGKNIETVRHEILHILGTLR